MNVKNFLIKNLIAPHGITDLPHSIINNKYTELTKIQVGTICVSKIIAHTFKLNSILDLLFYTSTAYHFRNDFKNFKFKNIKIHKILASSIFISSCILCDKFIPLEIGADLVVLFMSFIHVPNHYKNYLKHMKKDPLLYFFIISFFTTLVNGATTLNPLLMFNENSILFFKAITISHVIYSEMYVT